SWAAPEMTGGTVDALGPPVISGAAQLGQFSETPQLYSARASGVPIKIIACGFRTGPYALTSKPAKPIRSVSDLKGKKIGIQPTARFVIDEILAKNGIDPSEVTIVNVGFDKAPLVRGDVDAIGGWITNTQALSVVGDDRIDLLTRDLGLSSYADVYFATDAAIEKDPETLA
ncbi:nitrate ABC transporter substrate-binding protein, partial [Mesorhizobium sp. M2A.F.Ca.ET.040.01.1.1]